MSKITTILIPFLVSKVLPHNHRLLYCIATAMVALREQLRVLSVISPLPTATPTPKLV